MSTSTDDTRDAGGRRPHAREPRLYRPRPAAIARRRTVWLWAGRAAVVIVVRGRVAVVHRRRAGSTSSSSGSPSGIWDSLVHLFTVGTAFGSIWVNLWITVQGGVLRLPPRHGGRGRSRYPSRLRIASWPLSSVLTSRSSTRSRASCSARSSSSPSASGSFPKSCSPRYWCSSSSSSTRSRVSARWTRTSSPTSGCSARHRCRLPGT